MKRITILGSVLLALFALGLMSPAMAGMKVPAPVGLDDLVAGPPVEFAKGGAFLEGPIMDLQGNLWVVSIASGMISKISPDGTWKDVFHSGGQPQGLEWGKDGKLYGTDRKRGVFVWDPKTGKVDDYCRYFQNENFHGPNDLIFDGQGGCYFTDPWGTSPVNPRGGIYYISPGGKEVKRLIDNMAFPNGIALSPDFGTLYIADCMRNQVWACPIASPGVINVGFSHIFNVLPNGGWGPDGMCVDEKGNLYAAQYGGGKVVVIGPCGATIGEIKLPVGAGSETTNCCFGVGPTANMLYITEAGDNVIWKVPMKVKGIKEWRDMR